MPDCINSGARFALLGSPKWSFAFELMTAPTVRSTVGIYDSAKNIMNHHLLLVLGCVLGLVAGESLDVKADELSNRVAFWEKHAFYCEDFPRGPKHPSEAPEETGQICKDGDMTLFNGLMCAAGDSRGCNAVQAAQNDDGRWFRSPRRRLTDNDGKPNSFSPDMALGAQLYLVRNRDKGAAERWLNWIDRNRPCLIGDEPNCIRSPIPRFCRDDSEKGCTVLPTHAATLKQSMDWLGTEMPNSIRTVASSLPVSATEKVRLSAEKNNLGYALHLVGVEVLLFRGMSKGDKNIDDAARILAQRQQENPFFLYLRDGPTQHIRDLVLKLCPSQDRPPTTRNDWAWQRDTAEEAWKKSDLWDCIFMARLLAVGKN